MACIRSIVDYAAPSLVTAPAGIIARLEKMQNEALRIMTGAPPWTKLTSLRIETNLPKIEIRLKQIVSTFTVKLSRAEDMRLITEEIAAILNTPYGQEWRQDPQNNVSQIPISTQHSTQLINQSPSQPSTQQPTQTSTEPPTQPTQSPTHPTQSPTQPLTQSTLSTQSTQPPTQQPQQLALISKSWSAHAAQWNILTIVDRSLYNTN